MLLVNTLESKTASNFANETGKCDAKRLQGIQWISKVHDELVQTCSTKLHSQQIICNNQNNKIKHFKHSAITFLNVITQQLCWQEIRRYLQCNLHECRPTLYVNRYMLQCNLHECTLYARMRNYFSLPCFIKAHSKVIILLLLENKSTFVLYCDRIPCLIHSYPFQSHVIRYLNNAN